MSTLPPVSYLTDLTDREWALLEPLLSLCWLLSPSDHKLTESSCSTSSLL
jgi:hypothetical protein